MGDRSWSSSSLSSASSTDEDGEQGRTAASSCLMGDMTQDETLVLGKIRSKMARFSHLVQITDVRKRSLNELRAVCQVFFSSCDRDHESVALICVLHNMEGFRIELLSDPCPEMNELVEDLNRFGGACISISALLERCAEMVQQLRLTQLMDTLGLEEAEDVSETRSVSSGATAASPQSSCSTIPSVRDD